VALTPASVVPITPVIVAVVISVTAGMTGMGDTSLRRRNSDIAVLGSPITRNCLTMPYLKARSTSGKKYRRS